MMYPTGALSVVQAFMDEARVCEVRAQNMMDNEAYNTAIEQKLEAEKLKAQAGMEFLLWALAAMTMPDEPNPWQEYLAKQKAAREAKEHNNGNE